MCAPFPIDGAVPSAGNELPGVAYAECFCGQVEAFPPAMGLPSGWRQLGAARVQCPDCAAGERLELIPADAAKGGHHGCRLIHNIVGRDAVVLRIHAGARPTGAAADVPVMFLARRCDLRELIESLEAIDASLTEATDASILKGNLNV